MGQEPGKAGLSSLDLMNSTPGANRVVKLMLRHPRVSYKDLLAEVTGLPEGKRMTEQELREALDTLLNLGWLTRTDESGQEMYQVILKPKSSSAEMLHSNSLPQIDVSTDKKMDPGLTPPVPAAPQEKKGGFLRWLFGGKK